MANRTVVFVDQGALKGVSSTGDTIGTSGLISGAATDLTLSRANSATTTVTIDSNSVNFGSALAGLEVGASTFALANSVATTINFGGAATTLNMSLAGGLADIKGNAIVRGDLTVMGTTTTTHEESLQIGDEYIDMNFGDTTVAAATSGMVVNYLPTATTDTVAAGGFTAGVPATSNPTVATTGAATFAATDIIMISGTTVAGNSGFFEVKSHAANVLTVQGIGLTGTVEDFSHNQFTTSAGAVGTITKVNVSIMRSGTDGVWEMGKGNQTPITYSDLASGATTTLQIAYDNGQTITTSGAKGNMTINGTEDLIIGGSVDVSLSTTGTITQTGAGQITLNGNIDATNGLDVTVANLTVGGANFSVTPAGVMTVASTSNLNGAVNLGDNIADLIAVTGAVNTNVYFSTGAKTIGWNTANNETLTLNNAGAGQLLAVVPGTHNETDLGLTGARWKTIWSQGDITTAGNLVSGASITVNGTTNTISGSAGITVDPTTTLTLEITDATATSFKIAESANNYFVADTQNGTEFVTVGNTLTSVNMVLADNRANAFTIKQGANSYFDITTTDAGETISIGNAVTNPGISLLGTGTLSLGGGLTVAGATQLNGTTGLGDAAGDTVTVKGNTIFSAATNPTVDFAGTGAVTATGNPTFNFGTSLSTFGGSVTVTGTANLNGAVNIGDAAGDNIAIGGTITSATITVSDANHTIATTSSANNRTLTFDNPGAGRLDVIVNDNLTVGGTTTLGDNAADTISLAGNVALSNVTNPTFDFASTGNVTATGNPTLNFGTGSATFGGTVNLNGAVNIGDAAGDNIAINGNITSANILLSDAAHSIGPNSANDRTFTFDNAGAGALNVVMNDNLTVAGTTSLNGIVNLGDAAGDNINVTGSVNTSLYFTTGAKTIGYNTANAETLTFNNAGAGALTSISPGTTAETDLGLVGTRFKDGYFSGTVNAATAVVAGNLNLSQVANTIGGTASITIDPTTTLTLTLTDNTASALLATEGANAYITCTTTDGSETITIGNTLTTINEVIGDNKANAFTIKEAANSYLDVTTTNGAEAITLGNATTNPSFTFSGTGTLTLPATVNATVIGETFVAGPAGVTANYVVYKNGTASEVVHAQANALSTSNTIVGVAHATKGAAANVIVDNVGIVTLDAEGVVAISAGDIVYLSATSAGEVTNVAPSSSGQVVAVLGYAKTSGAGGGTFTAYWAPRTPYLIP